MRQLKFIEWEQDGTVATVWLNKPPVNAVDAEMYVEIRDFFSEIAEYLPGARAVVLAGRGKHFCAGNDLSEFQVLDPNNAPSALKRAREAFWAIYESALPVIGAIHGAAVGTGLAIAASCDIVIAAEGARFGTPEVNVGVLGGAKHLSRLAPQGVVRLMHLTGDPYPAERLLPYGGIAQIVPADELVETARTVARSIARHSPATLRLAKSSLNAIEYMNLRDGYEREQSFTRELSAYDDSKEAVNAFLERREPVYTGR
jgi:enoyl-CoA hydratase